MKAKKRVTKLLLILFYLLIFGYSQYSYAVGEAEPLLKDGTISINRNTDLNPETVADMVRLLNERRVNRVVIRRVIPVDYLVTIINAVGAVGRTEELKALIDVPIDEGYRVRLGPAFLGVTTEVRAIIQITVREDQNLQQTFSNILHKIWERNTKIVNLITNILHIPVSDDQWHIILYGTYEEVRELIGEQRLYQVIYQVNHTTVIGLINEIRELQNEIIQAMEDAGFLRQGEQQRTTELRGSNLQIVGNFLVKCCSIQ